MTRSDSPSAKSVSHLRLDLDDLPSNKHFFRETKERDRLNFKFLFRKILNVVNVTENGLKILLLSLSCEK